MMHFSGRGILLDIEGTTSSIRFVYDQMFPLVRHELDRFLSEHYGTAELQGALDLMARDLGHASADRWLGSAEGPARLQAVADEVRRQMDADLKATGLKRLQGLIWRRAFEEGRLKSHVFEDVPGALRRWRERGYDVRIYSSGSVQAQQLFFRHTEYGDLSGWIGGYYDTTIGSKRQPGSYERIAGDFALPPDKILFVSDVVAELDAASQAGLVVALCCRPGNPPAPDPLTWPRIDSLDALQLE